MKTFFQLREAVQSADKKPENYTDPRTGKVKTRMVPTNRDMVKEEAGQITVGDYTTKHFDMCPSAAKLYSKIKDMTPMVHLVVENMMLHDLFFRLEKQAIAQGAIDADDLEKADHYAEMIMDNAEQMDLEEEHSYIDEVHMPKFEQLAGMYDDDEEDEEGMNEKTLTPAELKKREEIAKAIERENPNMPMAKKMAIATATAKKVAEGVEDVTSYGNRRLSSIARNPNHPDAAAAKGELARRRMRNEDVELDEATDPQTTKLRQLAQLGLVDKEQVNKLVQAFTQLRSGKSLTTQQKDMITGTFSDLVGIIAGDSQMFQKAKKAVAEEVEQVDELNKSTLASYTQKAAGSLAGNAAAAGYAGGQGKKAHPDIQRFMKNRMKGIQHAAKKLANEAAFDDESKAHDRHYAKQTPAVQNALDKYTRQGMSYKQAHKKISDPLTGHRLRKEITPLHEENLDEVSAVKLGQYSAKAAQQGGDKRIAGQKMADEKIRKKYGYSSDAKVAAGSLPKKESVELDEISQATKDRYIQKSAGSHQHNAAVARDAKSRGDETTYQKARRIMKKRNQGMGRAFGQTKDTM